MARRILIVSYFFPPLGGAGVYRAIKLVKYLPRFGWEVAVLAPEVPAYYIFDPSLEAEIPAGTRVIRSPSLDPFRLWARFAGRRGARDGGGVPAGAAFSRLARAAKGINTWVFLPDNSAGWRGSAVRAGRRFLESEGADLILSLSVPHTDHLIGRDLHRATGIPWIADFRDAWADNPDLTPPTPLHLFLQRKLERSVLEEASGVVAANETVRGLLERALGRPSPKRFTSIHNGYDEEDFRGLAPGAPPGPFTLLFAGTFHRRLDPRPLFEGIARALAAGPIPRDDLRLVIVGGQQDSLPLLLRAATILDRTELAGFLPHGEALRRVAAADLLLLLVSRTPGAEMFSTAKLYEYLRAGRPILVAAPDGEATRLVAACRAGASAPPDDPARIAEAILAAYAARSETRGRLVGDRERIGALAFEPQTAAFVGFAEGILSARPAPR